MNIMAGFIVGIVVLFGLFYWIYQQSRKTNAECIALLGFSAIDNGVEKRGQSAEGFDVFERTIAEGKLHGLPAQLAVRNIRSGGIAHAKRDRSALTVLSLQLLRPPAATLRLQPAGVMRAVEWFAGGAPDIVLTADKDFDQAWHLYSARGAVAIITVDASLRAELVRLYAATLPNGPSGVSNKLAAGLLLGSFELTETVARYYVVGTPSTQVGERLKLATPILARLAGVKI
jgi:hypothetical protein